MNSKKSTTKPNPDELKRELKNLNNSIKLKDFIEKKSTGISNVLIFVLFSILSTNIFLTYVLFKELKHVSKDLTLIQKRLNSLRDDVEIVEHKMTHIEPIYYKVRSIDKRLKDK